MRRAGLKKITKLVKGKKGSVRRSYWVKDAKTPEQEKINHAWANRIYKTGLKNSFGIWGATLGLRAGAKIDHHTPARGAFFGQLGGYAAGRYTAHKTFNTTKKLISDRDKRIIGLAGHVAAIGGAAYHLHSINKRFPGAFDFFSKD